MNAGAALLLVAAVTAALVLWFTVALWVATLLGPVLRQRREEVERKEEEENAHEAQGTRRFPRGAP